MYGHLLQVRIVIIAINIEGSNLAKDISGLSDGVFYRGFPRPELIFAANTRLKVDKVFPPDKNGIYELVLTTY